MPTFCNKKQTKSQISDRARKRGGFLFANGRAWSDQFGSSLHLKTKDLPEAKKGVLKILTLEDSLASCGETKKRVSAAHKLSGIFGRRKSSAQGNVAQLSHQTPQTATKVTAKQNCSPEVRFNHMECRVYNITVDDNPGVSTKGAAIGLDWEFQQEKPRSIEDYERERPPRRELKEMRISADEREKRLRNSGVSLKEIRMARKSIVIAKKHRRKTVRKFDKSHSSDKNAEVLEKVVECIKVQFGLKKRDDEEQDDLWHLAQKK